MCWLYRYRFLKHWILYMYTKDIIHIYECEHYYHSKIYTNYKPMTLKSLFITACRKFHLHMILTAVPAIYSIIHGVTNSI